MELVMTMKVFINLPTILKNVKWKEDLMKKMIRKPKNKNSARLADPVHF